jgi:hypothetical protein
MAHQWRGVAATDHGQEVTHTEATIGADHAIVIREQHVIAFAHG